MTRATATSRVTVANRTRGGKGKAGRDGAAAANRRGGSTVRQNAKGAGGAGGDERTARYSDGDLEPIRATLAAFRAGDFRPRPRHGDRGDTGHADGLMLAEIGLLADEVGSQLASLTSEVTDKAAQVRDIALITTTVALAGLTRQRTVDPTGEMLQLKQTVNTMVDQLSGAGEQR